LGQKNRKRLHLVAEPATCIGLLILWNVGLELSINILKENLHIVLVIGNGTQLLILLPSGM
jgi:hypothetical protein